MKRISIIIMMLALAMGLMQCKKNEDQPTPNGGESITITLEVKGNGTRVDVNTTTGLVNFETGDQIHVGSGGKYVGTLTYDGTVFTGAIANAVEGSPLQFYFLGNVTPAETLTSGVTETCSVVISDQTTSLPVISAAPSDENYTASNSSYTAQLLNKCALVKFNVTTASSAATCISGLNNKMTVSFADNTLTPSKEGNGAIKVAAGNGEKWAILLPQAALETGTMGTAYSEDIVYSGTRGSVPVIVENGYLTVGIPVYVSTVINSADDYPGALNGKFTINDSGDQVYFSNGNLQYQASTGTWRFATNQYDCIGSANSNVSPTYDGWIDLFCWGTSGWDHGAVCYQPWSISTNDSDYFAYGDSNYDLNDQSGQADWGYNAISNGGNLPNQWRTLTKDEWDYVINTRLGIRYAKAVVNGVNGVVLLSDTWNPNVYALNNTNEDNVAFDVNEITATDWDTMESSGAVFLPVTGYTEGTTVLDVDSDGHYWSTKHQYYSFMASAWKLRFNNGSCHTDYWYSLLHAGSSVRLVHDAN